MVMHEQVPVLKTEVSTNEDVENRYNYLHNKNAKINNFLKIKLFSEYVHVVKINNYILRG